MTTNTAAMLIDKLRHSPEILEAIRLQLNTEHLSNSPIAAEQPKPAPQKRPDNKPRDAEIAAKVHAGTHTRAQVAIEYQLSLPRINQIMQMNPPAEGTVRANKNAERDRLILDAVGRNVPRVDLARTYGLSLERVNQICRGVAKPKKRTFEMRLAEALVKYKAFDDLTFAEECTLFIGLHEQIARQVVRDMDNGMEQAEIEAKYPPDCTGQDLPLTYDHYNVAYRYFIDPATGAWKR